MTCSRFRRLVVLMEISELSERQQSALERHLERCPLCAQWAVEMRAVQRLLRAQSAFLPPADFQISVMEKIRVARSQGMPRSEA